jgi:hypothetical protein
MSKIPFLILSLVSFPALAHDDPSIRPVRKEIWSRGTSCAVVRASVIRHGAVIVHYGEDLYERVVDGYRYCDRGDTLEPFWVPARDGECFAGYLCGPNIGG